MSLPAFVDNTTLHADDLREVIEHLQGASGKTEAWHFRTSVGNNFVVTLSDNAGVRKWTVRDSDLNEVLSVDSNGNLVIAGSFSPSGFVLPSAVAPAPTAEGEIWWDTDDNLISVGDGAAPKLITPDPTMAAGGLKYATGARTRATLAIGTAGQVLQVNAGATAPQWGAADFHAGWLGTMLSPTYKGFWWTSAAHGSLGSTNGTTTYAMGFGCLASSGSSGSVANSTADYTAWLLSTGATSGSHGNITGPSQVIANDYTAFFRVKIPSSANQFVIMGVTTNNVPTDQNGSIGFRVSGTGNVFGFVDNAGTETTRDSGATGVTEATYHYVVSAGGTIVRFYKNNVQIGADVTTNIPALTTAVQVGISTSTTADKSMTVYEFGGYREVA